MFAQDVGAEEIILHLALDIVVHKTHRKASSFGYYTYIETNQGR
jgi:hypothetical protein